MDIHISVYRAGGKGDTTSMHCISASALADKQICRVADSEYASHLPLVVAGYPHTEYQDIHLVLLLLVEL